MKSFFKRLFPLQLLKLHLGHQRTAPHTAFPVEDIATAFDAILLQLCKTLNDSTHPQQALQDACGFQLDVRLSTIPHAGYGVFLNGRVPAHTVVCMYPGLLYEPWHPVLLPSLRNQYMFRLSDGSILDGKAHGMSGSMYASIVKRDALGPGLYAADLSWLRFVTSLHRRQPDMALLKHTHCCTFIRGRNPLACGQIVNNAPNPSLSNVAYLEYHLPGNFPLNYRQHLPVARYEGLVPQDFTAKRSLAMIVLITRHDVADQELLSVYMERV